MSVAFDSIPLLSQIDGGNPTSNFGFSAKRDYKSFTVRKSDGEVLSMIRETAEI
jgi:hypothetical protein